MLSNILALGAAVSIALSGMIIGELRGKVPLFRLAVWQMTAATVMTGIASLFTGGWRAVLQWELAALAASSLFGIMIASTTYFAAIYAAGPRVTALMFSLTAPFALALGYLFYGESITPRQGLGVALVLAGIVLAIGLPGSGTSGAQPAHPATPVPWRGVGLGLITALGQAAGSLFARPAMAAGVEPFTAMAIRAGLAAMFFLLLTRLPLPAFRDRPPFVARQLGLAVTGAFFGTGLGMSLLMAALAHGTVGIVSTLSSMTPVVILPMLWIRTGTPPRLTAWAGAALAVAGTACISL